MSDDRDLDRLIRDARPAVPAGFAGAVVQKMVAEAARITRRRRRWQAAGAVFAVAAAAAVAVVLLGGRAPAGRPQPGQVWLVDGQEELSAPISIANGAELRLTRGASSARLTGAAAVTTDGNDLILQHGTVRLSGPAAVTTPWARVVAIGDAALVDVHLEPQEKAMTTAKLGVLAAVAAGSTLTVTVIRGTADVRPAPPEKPVTLAAGETLRLPAETPLVAGGERATPGPAGGIAREAPAGAPDEAGAECAPAAAGESGCPGCGGGECPGCGGGECPGCGGGECPGCGEAPEECEGGCVGGGGPDCAGRPVKIVDKLDEPAQVDFDLEGSPALGRSDAKVVIVEFGDFQCPFCEQAMSVVHQLAELYPNDVRVVFKNFPMPGHKNARLAAEAALAAGEQGKYWEMHDLLYANRDALDRGSIQGYAKSLGLDLGRFERALDEHTYARQIDRDVADATAAGIKGIPTFFINGRVVVGARPLEVLKGIVDEELARVN